MPLTCESILNRWLKAHGRAPEEAGAILRELDRVAAEHMAEATPWFPWKIAGRARAFEMSIAAEGFAIMWPSECKTWRDLLKWSRTPRGRTNVRQWAMSVGRTDRWRDLFDPQDLFTFFVILRAFTSNRRPHKLMNFRQASLEREVLLALGKAGLPTKASQYAADLLAVIKLKTLGIEYSLDKETRLATLRDARKRISRLVP